MPYYSAFLSGLPIFRLPAGRANGVAISGPKKGSHVDKQLPILYLRRDAPAAGRANAPARSGTKGAPTYTNNCQFCMQVDSMKAKTLPRTFRIARRPASLWRRIPLRFRDQQASLHRPSRNTRRSCLFLRFWRRATAVSKVHAVVHGKAMETDRASTCLYQ